MNKVEKQEVLSESQRREILERIVHLRRCSFDNAEMRKDLVETFGLSVYRANMIRNIGVYGCDLLIRVYLSGKINEAIADEVAQVLDPGRQDEILRSMNLHWHAKGIRGLKP